MLSNATNKPMLTAELGYICPSVTMVHKHWFKIYNGFNTAYHSWFFLTVKMEIIKTKSSYLLTSKLYHKSQHIFIVLRHP